MHSVTDDELRLYATDASDVTSRLARELLAIRKAGAPLVDEGVDADLRRMTEGGLLLQLGSQRRCLAAEQHPIAQQTYALRIAAIERELAVRNARTVAQRDRAAHGALDTLEDGIRALLATEPAVSEQQIQGAQMDLDSIHGGTPISIGQALIAAARQLHTLRAGLQALISSAVPVPPRSPAAPDGPRKADPAPPAEDLLPDDAEVSHRCARCGGALVVGPDDPHLDGVLEIHRIACPAPPPTEAAP